MKRSRKNVFKILIASFTILFISIFNTVTPAQTEIIQPLPSELTMAYHRPKDQPITQWLTLVYTEALRKMNIRLTVNIYPSNRTGIMSNQGKVDGELSRVHDYNTKFKNLIRVEEHVSLVRFSGFALDPDFHLNGWESLHDTKYRIVYLRGGKKVSEKLSSIVPSDQLTDIETLVQARKMLIYGRADIFVTSEGPMLSYLKGNKTRNENQKIFHIGLLEEMKGHAWLYKKYAHLAPQFSNTLRKMKTEGLFEIYRDQVGLLPAEVNW